MFEPPIDGVYLLTVYAIATPDQDGPVIIKNNDVELCRTWVAATSIETGTCSAVAQLAVGDSVRVTGDSSFAATIEAVYSGFVGHIISDNLSS